MHYTIKQFADLSGVSTRTLRHYDDIGLLTPSKYTEAGYRLYGEAEVDRLQQILFYKELDVPLQEIGKLVEGSQQDVNLLETHLLALQQKQRRLKIVIGTLTKTIEEKKGGRKMSHSEKFEGLKKTWIAENEQTYGKEVREAYGDEVVDASNDKMMGLTDTQFQQMQKTEAQLIKELVLAMDENDVEGDRAKEAVELHKQWLSYSWPSYSEQAHQGLAEMYVADPRFTAYYDKHRDGATQFLRDAIHFHTK